MSWRSLDLSEAWEHPALAPVHHVLQALHDEEHEWGDPAGLVGFGELLEHRHDEQVVHALLPWLLRYVWSKPFPAYAARAWWVIEQLVEDPEELRDDALEILRHHPLGAVRAQVLAPADQAPPDFLEDDDLVALVRTLSASDPHPEVRARAWAHLDFIGLGAADLEALLEGMLDPAPEVRRAVCGPLSELRLDEGESTRRREVQEAALLAAENRYVLAPLLSAYLRTEGLFRAPGRAAFALDLLRSELPFREDVIRTVSWQVPWGTEPHGILVERWVSRGPFGSGKGFLDHLEGLFREVDAAPQARADALHALFVYREVQRVSLQEAFDFVLEPALDGSALTTVLDAVVLRRAWFALPVPPVEQAGDRLELFGLLRDRLFQTEGTARALRSVVESALEIVRHPTIGAVYAQPLLDAAIDAVADHPGDASFGLYDLDRLGETLSFAALTRALHRATASTADDLAVYAAQAFAVHPNEDRRAALMAGLARVGSGFALRRLVDELPPAEALTGGRLNELRAALREAVERCAPNAWERSVIDGWLQG